MTNQFIPFFLLLIYWFSDFSQVTFKTFKMVLKVLFNQLDTENRHNKG